MWVKHVKCEKYVLFNISFENVHCDRFYNKTLVDMPIKNVIVVKCKVREIAG